MSTSKQLTLSLKRIRAMRERLKSHPSKRLLYWLYMEVQERQLVLDTTPHMR